jgi:hypothetical protein
MIDRPIIFSGAMVRAILDGRKTQTRRLVDMRRIEFVGGKGQESDPESWGRFFEGPDHSGYMVLARGKNERHNHGSISIRCPYGEFGDRLWVRETWCLAHPDYHTEEEGERRGRPIRNGRWCHYAASDDVDYDDNLSPWRSPVFMPRWASRINLETIEVRVQRLQDISEEDARAEGLHWWSKDGSLRKWGLAERHVSGELDSVKPWAEMAHSHTEAFGRLWDSTNTKRAPWVSNPWVWAISFRRA